jgi:4-amino-4-deoxy-L-arabinose transferase-like glycosyltransferase
MRRIKNEISDFIINRKTLVALFLLVAVAAFLRFKGLTFQSYWGDELFSAAASDPDHSLRNAVSKTVNNVHPPLYQVLLWAWYKIFGYTEFAGRSLSAVVGVLLIPAIYLLGKEYFEKRVGLYAAVIAVFTYYFIRYSQEARSYSLMVLLVTVSFICFIRLLREQNRQNLVLYIISIVATLYTHYYGLLIFASHAVCMMIYFLRVGMSRSMLKYCLLAIAIPGVLLLPLLPYIAMNSGGRGLGWLSQPEPWFFMEYLQKYFLSGYLALIFGFFMILGIIRTWRLGGRERYVTLMILGLWLAFVFILPYIKGVVNKPALHPRYTIIALPALIVLASAGIAFLKWGCVRHLTLVLTSLMALFSLHHAGYYVTTIKQPVRELLRDLIEVNISGMPVFGTFPERFNVYFKQFGDNNRAVISSKKLEEFLSGNGAAKCFWLLGDHKKLFKAGFMEGHRLYQVGKIERYSIDVDETEALPLRVLLLSTQGPDLASCPEINNTSGLLIPNPE